MEQCRAQMGLELQLGATAAQQLGMHAPPAQLQLGMHAPPAQLQPGMHAPPALLQLGTQAPIVVGVMVSSMMDAMLQQPAAPAYVQHLVWQHVAVGEQYPFTEMTWEAGFHQRMAYLMWAAGVCNKRGSKLAVLPVP
jgi:hypothetical protein